jgi:tRNA (guanine10-N2)-dimethyltransferase
MNLIILSGENIPFAAAEATSTLNLDTIKLDNRVALTSINKKNLNDAPTLAFTHSIHTLIFSTTRSQLKTKLKTADLNKYYEKNFAARILTIGKTSSNYTEQQLGGLVWQYIKNPRVNLSNPHTEFYFIFTKNRVYLTTQILHLQHNFHDRKAHKRHVLHPSSLSPKLAAGMVNLLKAPTKSLVVDPFVGTAGILIEAAILNYKTLGFDINSWMLKASEKNLRPYKNYKLKQADATDVKNYKNISYICSDLPYSKNTRDVNIKKLYASFFNVLKLIKVKRAVIGLPHFTQYKNLNYKSLIKKSKLKLKHKFKFYLHKNLTKLILVIES